MSRSPILQEASIQPQVMKYHVVGLVIFCVCTVVGIILLPILLPIVWWAMGRYYARLKITLTRRDLKIERGILSREEKSIPLEKITDLAVFQGPIMRYFGVKGIRVETAGQSSQGALVSVIGIENVDAFRDAVLEQRDRVSDRDDQDSSQAATSQAVDTNTAALLTEIRDSLKRIETLMQR
jgi:putative membrane protein